MNEGRIPNKITGDFNSTRATSHIGLAILRFPFRPYKTP
jgi:hypothetical protein